VGRRNVRHRHGAAAPVGVDGGRAGRAGNRVGPRRLRARGGGVVLGRDDRADRIAGREVTDVLPAVTLARLQILVRADPLTLLGLSLAARARGGPVAELEAVAARYLLAGA